MTPTVAVPVAAAGFAVMTATLRRAHCAGRGARGPVDRPAGQAGPVDGPEAQEAAAVAVDGVEEEEPEEESVDEEDDAPSEEDAGAADPAAFGLLLDPESVL